MRVLLLSPHCDGTDVGEAFVAFKWAEALSRIVDLTVLSFQNPERKPLAEQLPEARVVVWDEPRTFKRFERFNAMLNPMYPRFCSHVRKWLKDALKQGEYFDIAHQLMPQAARYSIPLRHFDIPYVIGPLGGALQTPSAFQSEEGASPWFTKLRRLDHWRFRNDPWLRRSYSQADILFGVAPYMQELLSSIPLKRFEPLLELGIDDLPPEVDRRNSLSSGGVKLLHVGRGVRTKGLRDAVRALAHLKHMPNVTLTSAGTGAEVELCRAEAMRIGVADRVEFLGRIPRAEVEKLYQTHDVFVFPSFREPAGNVVYEAMRWGLPIIAAMRGGPAWIVDDTCGIRIPVTDPAQFSADIAEAISHLARNDSLRKNLGAAGRKKVFEEGLWKRKADILIRQYQSVLERGAG